jgi:peptide/nickel transport system permease protein
VFGTPALELILSKMPATIELALFAMLIAVLLGIPLGLVAGLKPDSFIGRSIMALSIVGFSLPTFWVGLVLIMFFAIQLGWLPSNGRGDTAMLFGVPVSFLTIDGLSHLFLPAFNLALFKLSLLIRLTRAQVRETVLQDYIKFARAKGLSQSRVIGVHVLKNIMIPIVTVIGLEFGSVIAFAIVTESIFAWPGTGKLLIDSITQLDRPVIVAYLMVIVTLFILINFIVDMVYSFLDPRVRLGGSNASGGH